MDGIPLPALPLQPFPSRLSNNMIFSNSMRVVLLIQTPVPAGFEPTYTGTGDIARCIYLFK